MIHTEGRLRLCRTLTACCLVFIWGNSLLPAEVSQAFSDGVKAVLSWLFPGGGALTGGTGSGLLRKMAHFGEFAALGMLLAWRRGMLGKRLLPALLPGVLTACVDETIQLFVPGRGPGLPDVLLDSCGAAVGIALLHFGHFLLRKRIRSSFLEDN